MKRCDTFFDELINAFVDHELLPDEMLEFCDAMERNHALAQQVCRILTLHSMIQNAYAEGTFQPPMRL